MIEALLDKTAALNTSRGWAEEAASVPTLTDLKRVWLMLGVETRHDEVLAVPVQEQRADQTVGVFRRGHLALWVEQRRRFAHHLQADELHALRAALFRLMGILQIRSGWCGVSGHRPVVDPPV